MPSRYSVQKTVSLPEQAKQFWLLYNLPRIKMGECALCGARFPRSEKRILCWVHTEVIRGLQTGCDPEAVTSVRQPPRRGGLPIE